MKVKGQAEICGIFFLLCTFNLKGVNKLFKNGKCFFIGLEKFNPHLMFAILICAAMHRTPGDLDQVFFQSECQRNGVLFINREMGFQ